MSGRQKGGPAAWALSLLRTCITKGLDATASERRQVAGEMEIICDVSSMVDAHGDDYDMRLAAFEEKIRVLAVSPNAREQDMAHLMERWRPGLFIGDGMAERQYDVSARQPFFPEDNYELERNFRGPKHHQRRVHGRAHAGTVLVQRGATLLPTLDAHEMHPEPFTHEDLRPYLGAPEPLQQYEARARGTIMRRARSEKQRPRLLKELQERYLNAV